MLRAIFFNNGARYPEDNFVEGVLIVEEKYESKIKEFIEHTKMDLGSVLHKKALIDYCNENKIVYLYFDNEEEYGYD